MKKDKTVTEAPVKQTQVEKTAPAKELKAKPTKTVAAETKAKSKPAATKPTGSKKSNVAIEPVAGIEGLSMSERMGLTAGSIWHYLDKNGATSVVKLVRELPAEEKIIQRSIGWLAKENKITLTVIDRVETIALQE